jgi:hypothetical protein
LVPCTHKIAFSCVKSAFDTKNNDTFLEVILISYISMRDLPTDLQQYKNNIKIREIPLKHFTSDLHDKIITRSEYYYDHDMIIETDQRCIFMFNWDTYLLNDLDKCPPYSVITTIPGLKFQSTFIKMHKGSLVPGYMNHIPPNPVPSLFWSGIVSYSKYPWISEEYTDTDRESGQTYVFFKHNIPLYAPTICPIKLQYKITPKQFRNLNKHDKIYTEHIGLNHSIESYARAICGLTKDASVSEKIAKYGSNQLADNECLLVEKKLSNSK